MADLDGKAVLDQDLGDANLSMDAYHRGCGVSMLGLPELVGKYHFTVGSDMLFTGYRQTDAAFAGFYSASCSGDGRDIIAYRGTDDAKDIPFGWLIGAGIPSIGTRDALKYASPSSSTGMRSDSTA